ncbi:MAG TPA: cell division protein ZapE [Acetobacteraceae bacterium]|nr:cell division protein ZapE [Acetobacteraceae bacterium]
MLAPTPAAPTPAAPTTGRGPLAAYRARLASGELATDPAQALAAERLQDLWAKLRGYDPDPHPAHPGVLGRLLRRRPAEGADPARPGGLYLVGEVGRGKSMLMDLFFAEAEVARKRRTHFDRFMQDAHARIHAAKRARPEIDDPIPPLADALAAEAALLCLDEFQVGDIADAMLLGRLFEALFARGVVVVATSNTPPEALFAGQPGRDAFLPFIAILQQHLDVLVLEGGRDWRRRALAARPAWLVPADAAARAALDAAFSELAQGAAPRTERLTVMGRTLVVPQAADGVARFSFAALCESPLGAGDYIAVATHYPTLLLDGVPVFSAERVEQARRFVRLVDTLYDHRVKLLASAAAEPDALWPGAIDPAFARTVSRLVEMGRADWLERPHLT